MTNKDNKYSKDSSELGATEELCNFLDTPIDCEDTEALSTLLGLCDSLIENFATIPEDKLHLTVVGTHTVVVPTIRLVAIFSQLMDALYAYTAIKYAQLSEEERMAKILSSKEGNTVVNFANSLRRILLDLYECGEEVALETLKRKEQLDKEAVKH